MLMGIEVSANIRWWPQFYCHGVDQNQLLSINISDKKCVCCYSSYSSISVPPYIVSHFLRKYVQRALFRSTSTLSTSNNLKFCSFYYNNNIIIIGSYCFFYFVSLVTRHVLIVASLIIYYNIHSSNILHRF